MNNIWFTSDTHFGHNNIIKYCLRPFANAAEMDEAMVERWNAKVKPGDRVYHLGDFAQGNIERQIKTFNKLNGQKFLIKGNHDDMKACHEMGWVWIKEQFGLKVGKDYIWLNHYPMRSWNKSYHGSWHLFGHVHGQCKVYGKSFEASVDAWGYAPVNFEEVKFVMDRIPKQNPEFDCLFYQRPDMFSGTKLLEDIRGEQRSI